MQAAATSVGPWDCVFGAGVPEALATSLLDTALAMAVPLLLAALGELLAERAGIVNIGLEGMMLTGAFAAMVAAYASAQPWLGVIASAGAGALLGAVLAIAVVGFGANQVVSGTAINLLALGATGVGYRAIFGVTGSALTIDGFARSPIPGLSALPILGSTLFAQPVLAYAALVLVPLIAWWFRGTLSGLAWRMVGEDPYAAATQGVRVRLVRFLSLVSCGVLAGIGGGYLVLAYAKTFVEGMSAGRGFIALAIVILGAWSAWGILAAAVLFGLAIALQFHIQALGLAIPYQAALALPYMLTLAVLALYGSHSQAPLGLGRDESR